LGRIFVWQVGREEGGGGWFLGGGCRGGSDSLLVYDPKHG